MGRVFGGSSDFLFKQLNLILPNYFSLIAVTSIFFIYTVYFLINKTLKISQYWFAILLLLINPYVFLINLSGIRQSIALCFFVYAVYFAAKRKPFIYMLFVFIALGFHSSAIVLLPVYFLLNENKINTKRIIETIIIVGILLFTPLWDTLINFIIQYFPKYVHYVQNAGQNSIPATMVAGFFFIFILLNINKLEGKEIIIGKLALISTIVSLLAFRLSMITRIGMYFDLFMIIAIPLILPKIKIRLSREVLFILVIGIFVLRYISFFSDPLWGSFAEYQSILTVPVWNR